MVLNGDGNNNNEDDGHVSNRAKWKLNYLLQAVDDPSLVVEADKVWKSFKGKRSENKDTGKYLDRRFQHPQEKILANLAVASRIFKPIERSLKCDSPSGCLIDVNEANLFLSESAWVFKESGYGVLLPSWWNAKDNSLGVNVTLKLKSRKSTSVTGVNLLGLNSLLDFNWRFAVEGITLTESDS